ncbi:MAG: SGNH/GDSL hydrolase family protein [Planctomycetaceae bacterium]
MSGRQAQFSPASRRRRLVAIWSSQRPEVPTELLVESPSAEQPAVHQLSEVTSTPVTVGSSAVDVGPAMAPAVKLIGDDQPWSDKTGGALHKLVRETRPLTWVITGDSLEPMAGEREWRNFSGRLIEYLRLHRQRMEDAFVVTTSPLRRIGSLATELQTQLLRFQPDVVLLNVSPSEAEAGRRGLSTFEADLLRIVQASRAAGLQLCLATPPVTPLHPGVDPVDVLIYVEAVRSVAAEYDLPLVDHYAHWEEAARLMGSLERWFEPMSSWPGRIGHEQLTRRIIHDLGLSVPLPH